MEQNKTEESQHRHHHHHHKHRKPEAKSSFSLMLNIAIWLNVAYVAVALVTGFRAESLGLISDAALTLANVLVIAVAFFIHRTSAHKDNPRKAYAYRYRSIYTRLASILVMLMAAGALACESLRRMNLPIELDDSLPLPNGRLMLYVALAGVALHALTAIFLTHERKHNSVAGTPTAFWLSTAVSAVTALAGVIVMKVQDNLFDNVAALFASVLMVIESVTILYPVLRFAMGGSTDKVNRDYVSTVFKTHANVRGFGHMRILAVNNDEMALTAHIALFHREREAETRQELRQELQKLGIQHVTLEVSDERSKSDKESEE